MVKYEPTVAGMVDRTCRAGSWPNGKLLVVEQEISPPDEGARGKFSDLNMLVHAEVEMPGRSPRKI